MTTVIAWSEMSECGHVMDHNSVQDTIELLQARVSALDAATLDQVEARLQVHMTALAHQRHMVFTACSHTNSQGPLWIFQHLIK